MKIRKTFRLSPLAVAHLQRLQARTGATETALVELALAHLHHLFTVGPTRSPAASLADKSQAVEPRAAEEASAAVSRPPAKANKRRRSKKKRKRR